MPQEGIAIKKALFTWAREQAGYSLDDLPSEYRVWESGEERPSYRQLEEMAKRFEISVLVFFLPEPPDRQDFDADFRTLGEGAYGKLSLRMRRLMHFADYRRENLQALYARIRAPKRLIIHDLNPVVRENPDSLAPVVREYLGITTALQQEWAKRDRSFEMWRYSFLAAGIFVTILPFRQGDCDSFALYDPRFPSICVDRSAWQTQHGVLTMCHSLIHLLFHTCGIDCHDDSFMSKLDSENCRIEELCNLLSNEIVAPRESVRQEFCFRRQSHSLAQVTCQLSNLFHVPETWLVSRLLQMGLISAEEQQESMQELNQRIVAVAEDEESKAERALIELGEPFVSLAFGSYDKDFTEEEETLAEYVELYPRELDELREALARVQR